jgi:PAS domain S-box-containing protein
MISPDKLPALKARSMKILRSPHFWAILVLFVLISIHHYIQQIGIASSETQGLFGTSRHAFDRIIFLIPIIYAGFVFGLFAGLTTAFAAFLVMFPRAIFISEVPLDALLETAGVLAVGVLACLWLWTRSRERTRTEAALEALRSTHGILQQYVQSMRKNERRLTILNSISTILWGSLEFEGLLRKATTLVSELMEVEVTLLFRLDKENQRLELVGHEGVSDEFARSVNGVKIGEGPYGEVAKTGEPVVIEDLALDSKLTGLEFKKMQIRVQLIVPMILREHVSGVIGVAMRRPREFSIDDIELLTAVGGQIATAMENAQLYEKERLVVHRLAISEKNYRRLFENASDAIWTHDLEGNITVANKAGERLTGYSVEELMRMNVSRFLSADSLNIASQIRRKLFLKEPVEQPYEQHIIRRDGTKAILMMTTSLLTEDGKAIGFQHMARDMTDEKRMQDNLRYYLQQITTAQEEERTRIARELHDDTAQALYALNRQVDNFVRSNSNLPPENTTFLKELGEQIRTVLQGLRRFGQDLRPPMLDDLGLVATLRWLQGELKERSGIETDLIVDGPEQRLAPDIELMLFRIVQEALRNIEKHSSASKAEVSVRFGDGEITITVNDNGIGFELPEKIGDLSRSSKLGLLGMEERVRLLGGRLDIKSNLGEGTSVTIEAPIPQ